MKQKHDRSFNHPKIAGENSSISMQKERTPMALTVRSGLRAGCNCSDGCSGCGYGATSLCQMACVPGGI